ncbi:MAG: bifunctional serine/threonine-protein kinase/formylglycine-generating enzyme family protein [Planctomycetota bacterium]
MQNRTDRGEDNFELLLAECLERALADGERGLAEVCREHPAAAHRLREGVQRLRDAGFNVTAADEPTNVPKVDGYQLHRRLGGGGMGVVHLAQRDGDHRPVALKLVRPEFCGSREARERFRRETDAVARLEHPSIVSIVSVGCEGDQAYLAMEWVPGLNLLQVLQATEQRNVERLSGAHVASILAAHCGSAAHGDRDSSVFSQMTWNETCLYLVRAVAVALEHAHGRGVIHRDVKPSNLLVTREGRCVVIDFGLAFLPEATRLTRTGMAVGSLSYMSPEQLTAPEALDARTDVYSLGVTLYQLLTLRVPFLADSYDATRRQILGGLPPSLRSYNRQVPADLENVCLHAMNVDPRRRYPSMASFRRDVENLIHQRPVSARRMSPGQRLLLSLRSRPQQTLTMLLALVVIVAILAFALRERAFAASVRPLADRSLIRFLRGEIERFWPADPIDVLAMEGWLRRAHELLERRPLHAVALAELRKDALPYSDADRAQDQSGPRAALVGLRRELDALLRYLDDTQQPRSRESQQIGDLVRSIREQEVLLRTRRRWRFTSQVSQWRHDSQEELLTALDELADLTGAVEGQRDAAETIAAQHIERLGQWERAIDGIRAAYDGLCIEPQPDLIPLGRNPRSALWEFAHTRSGTVPRRGDSGEWVADGSTGIVLVLLPGGRHLMGASPADPLASEAEHPAHEVTLRPFLLSKYELTVGQLRRIRTAAGRATRHDRQAATLAWDDADAALRGTGLVLPTEAQWEYACRGGTTTRYVTGDDVESLQGFANLRDRTWLERHPGASGDQTCLRMLRDGSAGVAAIGSFAPNAFGLFDVVGNVSEWCRDPWVGRAYRTLVPRPGDGLRESSESNIGRVVRGGSWGDGARRTRSSARTLQVRQWGHRVGCRPARPLPPTSR